MDDVKDTAKKDTPSKFLDSTTVRTDAFGHNIAAHRAYRRAERIAAAVHLVTNHISEQEPVRRRIRKIAIELLSAILVLRDELRSPDSQVLAKTEGLVRNLISLIHILAVSGRLSMQNAEALIAASDELGVTLAQSHRTGLSERVLINRDDLAIEPRSTPQALSDIAKTRKRVYVKDRQRPTVTVSDTGAPMRVRSEEIVSVLTSQGQLGIKDIATNLPAYSEKMIQRELKQLVELGRVKKLGAKRWSTYALAK